MRALNKKMMTLACATCLTVGMGAVACADTVDLGYGLYGSTSPTVKAVEVMRVPTDAKLRNNEQSQIISGPRSMLFLSTPRSRAPMLSPASA